jgi:alcohol-forming fatty acyl-CoA reductase
LTANFANLVNCRLYKLYQKIDKLTSVNAHFTVNTWSFSDKNVVKLINKMTAADQEIFKLDLAKLNWEAYMADYYMGIRQFILKDEIATVPEAKKRYKRYNFLLDKATALNDLNDFDGYFNWHI